MTIARLTWMKGDEQVTEIVGIVPHDEPIYTTSDDGEVQIDCTTTDILDANPDLVYYEDETGVFSLKPEWVVAVEIIDQDAEFGRKNNTPYNEINLTKEIVMNNIKKIAKSTGNFVSKHRVALACTATALVVGQLQRSNIENWNKFLDDKGLTDEYYNNY